MHNLTTPTDVGVRAVSAARHQSIRHDVTELNEQVLLALRAMARRGDPTLQIPLVTRWPAVWRQLDAAGCRLAAAVPVLLLDVHFNEAAWWRWVAETARSRPRRPVAEPVGIPARQAAELLRQTMLVVWPAVRDHPRASRLLFGMSAAVADVIASLSARTIDRIAMRQAVAVRPRWEDVPAFWQSLLLVAIEHDTEQLHDLQLYAIQLVGGNTLAN